MRARGKGRKLVWQGDGNETQKVAQRRSLLGDVEGHVQREAEQRRLRQLSNLLRTVIANSDVECISPEKNNLIIPDRNGFVTRPEKLRKVLQWQMKIADCDNSAVEKNPQVEKIDVPVLGLAGCH